ERAGLGDAGAEPVGRPVQPHRAGRPVRGAASYRAPSLRRPALRPPAVGCPRVGADPVRLPAAAPPAAAPGPGDHRGGADLHAVAGGGHRLAVPLVHRLHRRRRGVERGHLHPGGGRARRGGQRAGDRPVVLRGAADRCRGVGPQQPAPTRRGAADRGPRPPGGAGGLLGGAVEHRGGGLRHRGRHRGLRAVLRRRAPGGHRPAAGRPGPPLVRQHPV
ncbi:MAG: hypothetical protein AVDCRST_MAG52-3064, partial [uncultured Blastococcus sp.]